MSYKELQIESVIDDENEVINEETMNFIYQMTELKKKKKSLIRQLMIFLKIKI